MTNGTVRGAQGGSLKIEYKGGVQEIEVAADVPIIRLLLWWWVIAVKT